MKKRNIAAVILTTLALATGCGAQSSSGTQASSSAQVSSSAQTSSAETIAASAKTDDAGAASKDTENKTDAQTSTITGTIDDIKDFMFTITDEKGDAYPMSFDAAPEGLSDVKAGDKVTVTYTGELSAVDAFTGTILSVKKAAK